MNRRTFAVTVFLAGVIAAVIALQFPATKQLFASIERAGYPGAFIAGILYGLSFTAASATVVFANEPQALNPIAVAVLGGLGAFLYDVSIFAVFRRQSHRHVVELFKARLPKWLPEWFLTLLGAAIIASPLPDELAAGMLGLSSMRVWHFLVLSFFLNTLGIFVIVALGR